MTDIILEILLVIVVGIAFYAILQKERQKKLNKYILYGFALILFGALIDVTDNFPSLNKYIIVGDNACQSFLEKIVGYLFGFTFLAIGFWKWLPGTSVRKTGNDKSEIPVNEIMSSENKLLNSLTFQQELLNAIPVPVFYKNKEGIYLGCNREFEFFLGIGEGEIIGKSVYDVAPKELADGYYGKDMELFNNPGTQIYEFEVKNKLNHIRTVIFHKATFHDSNGDVSGLIGAILDITVRKEAENEREKLISELKVALDKVKVLSGFLPICASCKNIRDDKGYWSKIEEYISEHSDAEFSHGICPVCIKTLYPGFED
ncbi:MAG: PAS domain-containing protein [Planctomycetes bacterium]|nr:PAS domain-containing protein [Planctomycetota bacterium]